MPTFRWAPALLALALAACGSSDPVTPPPPAFQAAAFRAPAGDQPASTSTTVDGRSGAILPSGRFVTPAGTEISVQAPKPHVLCLSRDGTTALTVNLMGTNPAGLFPFSVTKISGLGGTPLATSLPVDATYNGCAFSADGSRFYASGGDNGNIWVGDTATGEFIGSVNLSGPAHPIDGPTTATDTTLMARSFKGAFAGKMALSADGNYLYVVDQGAFKLKVIDTRLIQTVTPGQPITDANNFPAVAGAVDTGHYPYAVALTPDGRHALVANVGVFRYTHLRPATPTGDKNLDYPLCYPAAGYPDDVAQPQTVEIQPVDPRALPDTLREAGAIRCGYVGAGANYVVPAVGDPNAPESSSVWVYSLSDPASPVATTKVPTGARIGAVEDGLATYGASHPNSIAAGARGIYVALGNHDAIAVLDPATFAERARIPLAALSGADAVMKGVLPSELALTADGTTLYVAEAGINAIGVVALGASGGLDGAARLLGHIPTGWWPSSVLLSPDGATLYVANAKGRGAGPTSVAGNPIALVNSPQAAQGAKNTTIGTLNIIPVPDAATLAGYTAQVLRNNGLVAGAPAPASGPVPAQFGTRSSRIRHVVLINKENATHDLLLGHITQTRRGDAVAGMPAWSVGQTNVPNHTELALQFALSDNFYLEPISSSEGHRWLQGFYATEFEETHWPPAYGQRRTESFDNAAVIAEFPGRIGFSGVNESPEPIDYNKHGGVFLHLVRNGRSVLNFGNGTEVANVDETDDSSPTGTRQHVNIPMMKVLRDNSDHLYAGFNTHIPDSPLPNDPGRYNRFARFKQVFDSQFAVNGECRLPDYTTLFFPNDHSGPPDGMESGSAWSFERYVQDNDAALGRAVELISNSACWSDTVIFVLEDDTQNGADHVDGHRSVLLVISPWAKREAVSHAHTSLPSVFKTIYLILGVPPLNQYDAAATDLRDLFADTADDTPYAFQPITFVSTAASAQSLAWQRATRGVDFGEMDGDEVNLRAAIVESLGLPRTGALPLHESNPEIYALAGLDKVRRRLAALGR